MRERRERERERRQRNEREKRGRKRDNLFHDFLAPELVIQDNNFQALFKKKRMNPNLPERVGIILG